MKHDLISKEAQDMIDADNATPEMRVVHFMLGVIIVVAGTVAAWYVATH